ncbi:MAG: retropepsin-like aspartic protease [Deltaproteobacteria bacterium]
MKVRRFDPADDLIIVKARLYGPRGHRPLSLAFDTAASETHIVPEIIDDLGYSPRQGEQITSVTSAIGKERGYMLRVSRFEALGFSFDDFAVHVHDLPEGIGIDGLLGLSFLRRFNYEVRSIEGRILIDLA